MFLILSSEEETQHKPAVSSLRHYILTVQGEEHWHCCSIRFVNSLPGAGLLWGVWGTVVLTLQQGAWEQLLGAMGGSSLSPQLPVPRVVSTHPAREMPSPGQLIASTEFGSKP